MTMISQAKYVDGLFYPECHPGWGGCAEELFHYTSRYSAYTEALLRNLSDQRQFNMSGYQAANLSHEQRRLMAAILAHKPCCRTARDITQIIRGVINGEPHVSEALTSHYEDQLKVIPKDVELVCSGKAHPHETPDVAPLDPLLNLASRLQLPVAVRGSHVEIPLKELAQHLDSSNSSLRNSLQEAILQLHFAGYQLKNHPGLTHREVRELSMKRPCEPPPAKYSPARHQRHH
ncbi:MAG: endonuclease [Candidatus Thiodiazotropha taylori]|nr:endonuclease [Candidatus Thiodiazotropha taylori]